MKVRTTISVDKYKLDKARRLLSSSVIWDSLSSLIEDTIDTIDIDLLVTNLIKSLNLDVVFPSHKEVILSRPKVRDSSAKIVREMRDGRI
ncbi:MAG: hypothetical protein Q6363_004725 [Candidatus Njordarchaeota archaeon]